MNPIWTTEIGTETPDHAKTPVQRSFRYKILDLTHRALFLKNASRMLQSPVSVAVYSSITCEQDRSSDREASSVKKNSLLLSLGALDLLEIRVPQDLMVNSVRTGLDTHIDLYVDCTQLELNQK